MAMNIFGTDGFFNNNKVQNLSAVAGSTSVAGTLIVGGKGYVGLGRPIMSGGFTMLTPVTVSLTSAETTLLGSGLGSLITPANTIAVGQSSHSVASGHIGINLSPTLTLRLKGGPASSINLAVITIPLSTITAGSAWKLTSDYTVKSIGAAGVASMYVNSTFIVYDTINPPTYASSTLNTTTFDTTVNNVISLTAQWSVAASTNTITCSQFTTNSVYTP